MNSSYNAHDLEKYGSSTSVLQRPDLEMMIEFYAQIYSNFNVNRIEVE